MKRRKTKGNAKRRARLECLEQRLPLAAPHPLDLGTLASGDGTTGFVVNGENTGRFGASFGFDASTIGDVNGDGFDDFVVGAPFAQGGYTGPGTSLAGESYVVFGKSTGYPAEIDIADLDGTNGFRLPGQNQENRTGTVVSAGGDINGDGLHDIVVDGNTASDPENPNKERVGAVYVVFGQTEPFPSTLNFNDLDGTNGFTIVGNDAQDHMGYNGGGGDFNGDGFDDLIFSAVNAFDPDVPPRGANPGEAYVLFGKADGWSSHFRLTQLDGANGFLIRVDPNVDYRLGRYLDGDGDFNGDGFDDILLGVSNARVNGELSGRAYVLFGGSNAFPSEFLLESINGTNGVRINGVEAGDWAGERVSFVGDVNGDGLTDVGVGADRSDDDSGAAYVVFGRTSGAIDIELSQLNGLNGFAVNPTDAGDQLGIYIDSVGDFNSDGYDDVGIGATRADLSGSNDGEAYILFGKSTPWPAIFDQSTLDGNNGFRAEGVDAGDNAGRVVTNAGDVNGDAFDDLIITANRADPNGSGSGEAYVIFGGDFTSSVSHHGDHDDNVLIGTSAADVMVGGLGDDTLIGGGGPDVLRGGHSDDVLEVSDSGFRRVDGGHGIDTLRLSGSGITLDLTTYVRESISGIEWLDINGNGANTLKLNPLSVLNLSDTSNTVLVRAGSDDNVDIGSGWTSGSQETINGEIFEVYFLGQAVLKITTVISDSTAPAVSEVILGGSAWDSGFIDVVDGGVEPNSGNQMGIPLTQGVLIPNAGADRLFVVFDEAVLIASSDVEVIGSGGALGISELVWNDQTFVAEIRLAAPIEFDKVRLAIADSVVDGAGNRLDGDSNGDSGGVFDLRFDVLAGDINLDGHVFTTDLTPWQAAFNRTAGESDYNEAADLNASGHVFTTDLHVWQAHFNQNLSDLSEPAETTFQSSSQSQSSTGQQSNAGFDSSSTHSYLAVDLALQSENEDWDRWYDENESGLF